MRRRRDMLRGHRAADGAVGGHRSSDTPDVRRKASLVAALVLTWASVSSAQTWSSAQQALIDVVASCNDGWTESHRQQDYEVFANACPQVSEAVYWYTGGPAPVTYGGDDGVWVGSAAAGNLPTWSNLVPKTVQVQGDIGLIYFEVLWTINTPDGQRLQSPSRRMLVMRRINERWVVTGGMIAGIPQPPGEQ